MWCRVTGTVATSRSVTFTPTELHPTMSARLMTRAALLVSREVVITDPFSNEEAHALARRTASSGLTSTFTMPSTPSRPKSVRAPPDSHTIDAWTCAPASTTLYG